MKHRASPSASRRPSTSGPAALLFAACLAAAPGAGRAAAPEPAPVPVTVSSSPADALVTVDGAPRGATPVTVLLSPGRHVARLAPPGAAATFVEFETGETPSDAFFALPPPTVPALVESEPSGAEVTLDGATAGTTPLFLPSVPEGPHTFEFTLDGFRPQTRELRLSAPAPVRLLATLAPSTATLRVETDPPGASVSVNGVARGATPLDVQGLPEGDATLEISLPGHETYRTTVPGLAAGLVFPVRTSLRPLPAEVNVVTIPSGARIYADGAFAGVSPLALTNLPAGERRLRADMPGFDSLARTVTLAPGPNPAQEFRMRPNGGHVEFGTAPAGAKVVIDGEVRGVTSPAAGGSASDAVSGVFTVSNLPAGEHLLVVSRPGWDNLERRFRIERGQTEPLGTLELKRRFLPDFQIETRATGIVRGIFVEKTETHYRIEVSPGVIRAIPKTEIVRVNIIRHPQGPASPAPGSAAP